MKLRLNGEPVDLLEHWTIRLSHSLWGSSIELRRAEGFPFEPIPLAAGDLLQVFEGDRLLAEFVEHRGRAASPSELLQEVPA